MNLDKIETEISKLYQSPGLSLKQAHALIARYVVLMMLETRLEELESLHAIFDGDFRYAKEERIVDLELEIAKLKEG